MPKNDQFNRQQLNKVLRFRKSVLNQANQSRGGQRRNLQELLPLFGPGVPGVLQGTNQFITGITNRPEGTTPGFSDIFENFFANVQRQGARSSAALNEAFGSRGARFGSDVLRSQGDLQKDISQSLIGGAGALRQQEAQTASTLAAPLIQSGQIEAQLGENAFNRLMAEFLRQSAPPPLLAALGQFGINLGQSGQPTNIIQPRA